MRDLKAIAVFCGSNLGGSDVYADGARAPRRSAGGGQKLSLVYGGTTKGLMGVVADAALAAGGEVHGVITRAPARSAAIRTRASGAPTRSCRPPCAPARSGWRPADAFVALPGGVGTLEEFMEVWTQNQLGEFDKPAGLLDSGGFYQPLLAFVDQMIAAKFLPAPHRDFIEVDGDAVVLIEKLRGHRRVETPKWL